MREAVQAAVFVATPDSLYPIPLPQKGERPLSELLERSFVTIASVSRLSLRNNISS